MPRRKTSPEVLKADRDRMRKRRQNDIKLDRKIASLQNADISLIPKLPFSRLVREIMAEYKDDFRITAPALVVYIVVYLILV